MFETRITHPSFGGSFKRGPNGEFQQVLNDVPLFSIESVDFLAWQDAMDALPINGGAFGVALVQSPIKFERSLDGTGPGGKFTEFNAAAVVMSFPDADWASLKTIVAAVWPDLVAP